MAARGIDHPAEYVRLLGQFDLSPAEIRRQHGVDGESEAALRAAIGEETDDEPSEPALYRRAHRGLAHSSRGIDSRRRFWNQAPATQIDEVFDAIAHENASADPAVEDGFVRVDPERLTPAPEAVYEAMLGR